MERVTDMEDMDLDFDIGQDPVQQFLLHKLNEIKLNNEELERQINRRKDLITACLEKVSSDTTQHFLKVADVWQKTWNGKWIIGIEVASSGTIGTAKNVCATLQWDLPASLTYKTNIFCRYTQHQRDSQLSHSLKTIVTSLEQRKTDTKGHIENEWIKTAEITKFAIIVISFAIPDLVDQSKFKIGGVVSYEYNSKCFQLALSPIDISVSDLTDSKYGIKKLDILTGDVRAYLTIMSSSRETSLAVKCTQSNTNIENLLEFECRFKRAKVLSKSIRVFLVDDVCDALNGALITLEKGRDLLHNLVIYSRDVNSCDLTLHYIYAHIPDLLLLPKSKERVLLEENSRTSQSEIVQQQLRKFGTAMEAQLLLIQQFCDDQTEKVPLAMLTEGDVIDFNINLTNYQAFRDQLSVLEQEADLLYNSFSKPTPLIDKEDSA
ncbi:hypothetical protein PPYR_01020 [Photinus pyralis]|uniref:Uncharacterized protein n=3 Tax=Photinus pyralis TaxID=7054 RepID=A0A5N4B3U9_PHOPY|nr:hypothetical protein PPYR_01020 [Photinus pyralis]